MKIACEKCGKIIEQHSLSDVVCGSCLYKLQDTVQHQTANKAMCVSAEIKRLSSELNAALNDLFGMQKYVQILSNRCKFCDEAGCHDKDGCYAIDGGICCNGSQWRWRGLCSDNGGDINE